MAAYLVIFLLFYLPLVVIPIGISPFETPKVMLAQIIIAALLLFKIFQFKKSSLKNLNPQLIFIAVLFLLSLDTQVLFRPEGSFFGNVFRLQGQFLFWFLLLFALLSPTIKLNKIPPFIYQFSFICLFLGTVILGVNENNRSFGTLGEPNALVATALFIFPFAYFHSGKTALRIAFLIGAILIILLSGSRAGLIGFSLQALLISLINLKISTAKAGLIVLILLISSLFLPFIDYQGWFENRAEIWQTAVVAGFPSPILGHGFGSIQSIIKETAVKLNNNVQYQVVDSAHNFLLDFWIQGGLVGVTSILILILLAIKQFSSKLLMTAFLGLITTMLFNPVSVVNLLAFWWFIGQGSIIDKQDTFYIQ